MKLNICHWLVAVGLLQLFAIRGYALINGGFEATPFSTGWNVTGVPVSCPGLVAGSVQAARFTASGQALAQTVAWGADWYVDGYFAVKSATTRQFSLLILNGTNSIVNLRYEAGAWATFNGTAFVNEPSLGSLSPSVDANNDGDLEDAGDTKNVYRLRLTGRGFGTSAAVYDLQLSDANGTAFVRQVTGMTRWQNVSGTTATPNAIKFGSEFGNNPGWWLDEVTQHVEAPPPGPVTLPYVENFASTSHQFTAGSDWQIVNASFRNSITATPANGIASLLTNQLGGPPANASGFLISSKFTLVQNTGSGNSVGFGLMGSNATFSGGLALPYYAIDLRPSGNTVRCLRVGINTTSFLPETALRTFVIDTSVPFELEVRGTYEFEALKLDITIRQGSNSETFYAVDTVPLTVGYFGYRNRTTGGLLTVDCDDFVLKRLTTIQFTQTPRLLAQVGQNYTTTVAAQSNVDSPVTLSALNLPAWLSFTAGANGSATLSGLPSAAEAGSHALRIRASDLDGSQVEETFTLSVTALGGPIISEFLAENDSGLRDEDGDQPDWIEIMNPTPLPIVLSGWALTDDPLLPQKWLFPAGTEIPAYSWLTVFASEKNRTVTSPLHTNFKLTNAAGGHLQLTRPDGSVASAFVSYPAQRADRSYGVYGDHQTSGYFVTPTPGGDNGAVGYLGFVADTKFLVGRGYYSSPVVETISCTTPGATVVYTTDGSTPSLGNGTSGVSPLTLTITGTTVLRAAAFAPNLAASETDTQSYFFTTDIAAQPHNTPPLGWPQGPVNGQILDYGMDTRITSSVTPQQMHDALTAVPAISLVTDLPNLFDNERGIYVNPYGREDGYECPVSVELLNTNNSPGFQINAGLRIRGGASREGTVPKHNFHLYFRGQYGAAKLNFPLFGDEGADSFDRIDLRTAQVMGWAKDGSTAATYTRDEWNRLTHGAMGQPYTRSRYYHLYINGHYWGLYGTQERGDAQFAATYHGGTSANYDVMKTFVIPHRVSAADGDAAAWTQLFQAALAGFTTDTSYFAVQGLGPDGVSNGAPRLLDVDNLIDYTLLRYYAADDDAPVNPGVGVPKNFYAFRPRDGSVGYRFLTHDAESCMRSTAPTADFTTTITVGNTLNYFNPRWLSQQLAGNAKYRLRFADRAQKHLFHGGALATEKATARWQGLSSTISQAILAESARWGDAKSAASPRTVAQWQTAVNAVETSFILPRRATLIGQLRARGLFPSLDAPTASPEGGLVPMVSSVSLTAPAGTTIHYTLNDADPSEVNATPYTVPINLTGVLVSLKARARNTATGEWSALTQLNYTVGAAAATTGNFAVSEIHYNPPGASDETEFVEFLNTSSSRIDLTGVRLTSAVIFVFPNITLEPGERICVVENELAFRTAYGQAPRIAGVWSGALNNGGDRVEVVAEDGTPIEAVAYADVAPWPTAADGGGPSMVRIDPATAPIAENWRPSALSGGNPGTEDTVALAAWLATQGLSATADPDGNGLNAALEFALGMDLSPSEAAPAVQIQPVDESGSTITWPARIGATGLTLTPEVSTDLLDWEPWAGELTKEWLPDGRERVTTAFPTQDQRQYFRLKVTVP